MQLTEIHWTAQANYPILATLQGSFLKLLIEISLDFLNLDLERHFFRAHKEIFAAVENRQALETEALMKQDILDVKEKLKGFKKKNLRANS